MSQRTERTVSINKKASYNYFIRGEMEAGLVLTGPEVKSIRQHSVSLNEAYIQIDQHNNLEVIGMHIPSYKAASYQNLSPKRSRRLLLNKREIKKLKQSIEQKGMTIVPLRLYFKEQWIKMKIGICKGKNNMIKDKSKKKKKLKNKSIK